MARDPGERPASAGAFARDLARSLGSGVEADAPAAAAVAPTRVLPPPQRVARRRPDPAPAPQPQSPPAPPSAIAPRRRRSAIAFVPLVLFVAVAAVVAILLLSSGSGGGADQSGSEGVRQPSPTAQRPQGKANGKAEKAKKAKKKAPRESSPPAADQPAAQAPPPASDTTQPDTTGADPARGAQLNDQGFALMQRGDYASAVPVLQQAVAAWPQDSTDLRYAYALFNLGKALNRSGRGAEAIPYLEKRLNWDDQRSTVQAELDLARRNAGQ
jgi:hypothetical protein